MERHAAEWVGGRTMQVVTDGRATQLPHRHSDLMTAAGLDQQSYVGHESVLVEDAVVGDRFSCPTVAGFHFPHVEVIVLHQMGDYGPLRGLWAAFGQGTVNAVNVAVSKLALEVVLVACVACEDHHA